MVTVLIFFEFLMFGPILISTTNKLYSFCIKRKKKLYGSDNALN